jgi:hypothetical protein
MVLFKKRMGYRDIQRPIRGAKQGRTWGWRSTIQILSGKFTLEKFSIISEYWK